MGSRAGVEKSAATKVGCTVEAWRARRAAGERWCCRCRTWAPLSEFAQDASRGAGTSSKCRPCASLDSKACKYGTTYTRLRDMAKAQDCRCLICGRQRKLVVDHDHITGAVRGLLCSACNVGMGLLGDEPAVIRAAARYLEAASG